MSTKSRFDFTDRNCDLPSCGKPILEGPEPNYYNVVDGWGHFCSRECANAFPGWKVVGTRTASDKLDDGFEEEKRKTAECLADVCQFLSHDTSSTRRQLVEVLLQRAEIIIAQVRTDGIKQLIVHE